MDRDTDMGGGVGPMRQIGQSTLSAYPVALGGAVFGWTLPSGLSTVLLDKFVELGGNLIDTADSYSSGMSEQIIGRWVSHKKIRDKVLIATKVGRNPEFPGLSRTSILQAVETSLERLNTDYIDLLYFHAEDPDTPLEESLSAVAQLVEQGKVRVLGASNFSADRLLEARILAGDNLPRIEAVALEYSLMRRDIVEGNMAMMAKTQRISIMPYFVLANGFIGNRRNKKKFSPEDIRARRAARHISRHGTHVLDVVEDIALSHGVDISTVAAAWVLSRPEVSAAALGAESVSELEALMHAPFVDLGRHELAELEKVSQ